MKIERQAYDQLPFAIKIGALILWGTQLSSYSEAGRFRQLYQFNDFFAEMCFDEAQQTLTCICTFTELNSLEPYLNSMNWQDFYAEL
ncbi:hypothetical protein [Fibrisoma limi]|nr:hypothetical protein [Fibrisoma limi]